jgi:hypothetical protein
MMNRAKFELDLKINQITNFPFRTGTIQIRWHVKDSAAPDLRGRTTEVKVEENGAVFNYGKSAIVRIGIRNDVLRDSYIVFEVYWYQVSGTRLNIGNVEVNLSEYVHNAKGEAYSYLLRSSRVNCILNVSCLVVYYSDAGY